MNINFFRRLKIFSILTFGGIAFIGYAVFKSNQRLRNSEEWVRHTEIVISLTDNILAQAIDMQTASLNLVIARDTSKLNAIFVNRETLFKSIGELRALTRDNSMQQDRIDSLSLFIREREAFSSHLIAMSRTQGLNAALDYIRSTKSLRTVDNLHLITRSILLEENRLLQQREKENNQSAAELNRISLLILFILVILSVLFLIIARNYLAHAQEKEKTTADLTIAKNELYFQNHEREKSAEALIRANKSLKKADEKTIKVSDLNAFMSQVNQNIVRVKDQQTLFRNACSMAVEFGKFTMAWIGMVDITAKRITPLEQSGDQLKNLKLITDLPFQSGSAFEQVLRTGVYYISDNIENDDKLVNWKAFAARLGVHSCMLIPINKGGIVFGTLNLYSTELNFAEAEEIKLLVELAKDISFALDIFEKAKRHDIIEQLLKQNEKRFRALIEKSSDMVSLRNADGKLFYLSPSVFTVLGYTVADILKDPIFDLIHPDDVPGLQEQTQLILKRPGASFFRKQRYHHKNGEWIWCEGTVTNMMEEPGINALVSNFRDISERERGEQSLKKSTDEVKRAWRELQKIMDSSLDVICSIDENGKFVSVSAASKLVWGYEPDELAGRSFIDFVFHQDVESTKNVDSKVLSGTPVRIFENRYVRKDGSIVPIVWSARWDDTEKKVYCIARDVTEMKIYEHQLIFTKNNLKALINNTDDLMWSVDREFNLITSNDAFNRAVKRLSGFIPETGKPVPPPLNKEQLLFHSQNYERASSGETFTEIKHTEFPLDSWSEISYYPIYKDDTVVGTACFSHDITEQTKTENHLRLLESVITNTNDSVLITEAESPGGQGRKIIYVNDAFTTMTGYSKDEALGRTPSMLQGPNSNQAALRHLRKSLQNVESCEVEITNYKKNGDEFCVNMAISPVVDSEGQPTHFIAIERDVTERLKNLEAIKEQNTKLIEIARMQSHDVRGPLARILGLVNLLTNHSDGSDRDEVLGYLLPSANELDKVITRIVEKAQEVEA